TKKMHDAGYTIHDKENHESCIMNRESCIVSQASCILYLASLFSAVLAMKTKETAIMLPVTITLYEFMFFNDSRFTVHNLRFKKSILYLTPLLLTMLIIPLNLTTAIGLDNPAGELIEDIGKATRGSTSLSRWEYLFTEFRVIVTYIRLLFLPINQNFAYDYPYNSFLNANVFLSFLFLIFMFGLGVYLFYRSRVKKVSVISVSDSKSVPVNSVCVSKKLTLKTDTDTGKDTVYCSLIAFGIFWFFINMMLESSIIPLSNVIFEHRLYLPSIGFIIALSTAIFYFVSRFVYSTSRLSLSTVYCLLSTFVIVLSVATYNRNNIWKDDISLWGDVTRKSHGNGIGSIMSRKNLVMFYNIRGLDYRDRGLLDEAINEYRSALKLDPNIAKTHLNMGVAYKDKGMLDEAIMEYKNALRLKPDYAEVYNNLGVAYKNKGMLDEAVMEYKNALRLKPDYSEIHCNLGVVYRKQGRIDAAIREYKTALKIKPSYMEAHNNLGIAYMQKGMIKEADMEFRTALKFAGIEKP
ncbi:MAG: tetratricopeptide repeat protein, partial [Nitrospirae bacterium]|nr:tetratricopeptide repeat protein [Nitrospirota bacterium]